MSDDYSKIRTQWGSTARGFGSFSDEALQDLAQKVAGFVKEVADDTGISIFLSYGGLLGAVRNGRLIKHDFDIDLIFCSNREDLESNCSKLASYLLSRGAKLEVETNGQFKATVPIGGAAVQVEFFAGWVGDGKFFQYFAVPGTVPADDVFPLGEISLEGAAFPAPRNPIVLIEAIYGDNWRIPDPNFKYELSEDDWKPFSFLFLGRMRKFWDDYYAKAASQRVFVVHPSPFAIEIESGLHRGSRIVDFGCGNGRDSLHFAKNGHWVLSVDYSDSAVEYVRKLASSEGVGLHAEVLNVQSIPQTVQFGEKHADQFDVVYARFFTHAIDDLALHNFLKTAYTVVRHGGQLHIEFRARPDGVEESVYAASLNYENGEHFRRLRSRREMELQIEQAGLILEASKFGKGLAVWKDEDPLVGRMTAVK